MRLTILQRGSNWWSNPHATAQRINEGKELNKVKANKYKNTSTITINYLNLQ